jgi:hypothetical protein
MQDPIEPSYPMNAAPRPEQPEETLQLQRVDVLDLQQAIVANQLIPITHRGEPGNGVPFSALND